MGESVDLMNLLHIRREFTAPHSLEQNEVVERMKQTIQEWVVAMLHHSG